MSPKKLVLLTLTVAVLFGFIFLVERKMPTTDDRARKGDLYWDLPETRLERLTLTRGTEILEVEKSETTPWRIVKPAPYPADPFAVNAVAGELCDLKRAGSDSDEAKDSDYGFDQSAAKATLVWTEADEPAVRKTRTIEFGMELPGTDVVAARLEGTRKVLFVPASVLAAVRKNIDDFRSREVFGGAAADITRLEILRGRGRLMLARKDGDWWLSEPIADLAAAQEADRLAAQLMALRVVDFLHGTEDLVAIGLNPPLYRVTVTGAKGATVSVDFGATRPDRNNVYARRDGIVFTVDREIVDDLSSEAGPFRSATLTVFRRADVTGIEGTFAQGAFALAQKDGGWTAAGRPVLAPAVDDLLSAILNLKSRSFLEGASLGVLPPPVASVTVRLKTGPPWTLSFHARGEDMVARASPRPGAFGVEGDAPSKLEAAFAKAVAPPATPTTRKK